MLPSQAVTTIHDHGSLEVYSLTCFTVPSFNPPKFLISSGYLLQPIDTVHSSEQHKQPSVNLFRCYQSTLHVLMIVYKAMYLDLYMH